MELDNSSNLSRVLLGPARLLDKDIHRGLERRSLPRSGLLRSLLVASGGRGRIVRGDRQHRCHRYYRYLENVFSRVSLSGVSLMWVPLLYLGYPLLSYNPLEDLMPEIENGNGNRSTSLSHLQVLWTPRIRFWSPPSNFGRQASDFSPYASAPRHRRFVSQAENP